MLRTTIDLVLTCWVWLLSALGLLKKPRFVARLSEHHPAPEEIRTNELIIVQSGPHLKWACFICPCGCGEKIALSLAPNRRPRWTVSIDWQKRPTISPSVWQRAGCFSHFWLRKGEVDWCPGTGEPVDAEAMLEG